MSNTRQLTYFWQRHVLRRTTLLADQLPLGLAMKVYAADDVGRRLFKYKVHEPWLLRWLEACPAPTEGALALDVGANIGWYSLVLDRLAGASLQIHAFEPDPENRTLLLENIDRNRANNVTVSNLALGDSEGSAMLNQYRTINRGKHSLLPLEGAVGHIRVDVGTLDAYLDRAGLGNTEIWLLKLDVEGLEPAVLRGASTSLAHVARLILEYSPAFYAAAEAQAMLEQLYSAGLQPHLLKDGEWQPVTVAQLLMLEAQCDTVWCRR